VEPDFTREGGSIPVTLTFQVRPTILENPSKSPSRPEYDRQECHAVAHGPFGRHGPLTGLAQQNWQIKERKALEREAGRVQLHEWDEDVRGLSLRMLKDLMCFGERSVFTLMEGRKMCFSLITPPRGPFSVTI
jgi:hypothetical protein